MKQTKYMKQWFSEIWLQAAQSNNPGEKGNNSDDPCESPSLLTGEFPGKEGEPSLFSLSWGDKGEKEGRPKQL